MNIKSQKGITLVFAVLLMAAIMAASLAISALIVREVKLSQNIKQSVISYYGAESGLENVLYQYYKVAPLYEVPVGMSGSVGSVSDWDMTLNEDETSVTANLHWEETKEVPLYDVTTDEPFPGMQNVHISWSMAGETPDKIEWTLLSWNIESDEVVFNPVISGADVDKDLVKSENVIDRTIDIRLADYIDAGSIPILRFKHVGAGGQGKTIKFVVWADDGASLVDINQETGVKVTGTATGFDKDISRALEVNIPRKPAAFGAFDYVLFSDKDISKEWLP